MNRIKKAVYFLLIGGLGLFITTGTSSCKTKEGCGLEDKYSAPVDRNGNLSTKRGDSNLFSKKQRKRKKGS